jgi:hypothetical protein
MLTPESPHQLQSLNSHQYRTLNALFDRLSRLQPELNVALLDVIDQLDQTHQLKLLAILYCLEADRNLAATS